MKMTNKKLYKLVLAVAFIFFAVFFVTTIIYTFGGLTVSAHAQENQELLIDYSCDFSDNSVLVTMDKNRGGVNKLHNKSGFGGIAVSAITDLTYRDNMRNVDVDEFRQILKLELKYHDKNYVLHAVEEISKLEGIENVTPNYIGKFCAIANDPSYSSQWGLNGSAGINIENAWDITTGSRNVRVGVVDTGIALHTDLRDNLVGGRSFVDGDTSTEDTVGHGTHVAGIIGAVGDNRIGISGVCKTVQLVPLKISNSDSWATDKVVEAINYAETLWGTDEQIDVLNFSGWNFPNNSNLKNKIKNYHGLFVTIAGNAGTDIDATPNYPGCFEGDNIITVGSIDRGGNRSSFSNYGTKSVDIFAPGGTIYSTLPSNNYGNMSGTSMAAPHVTGVAALMLSINPCISGTQLKTSIINSADNINITVPTSSSGTVSQSVRKLNAFEAVKSIDPDTNAGTTLSVQYIEGSIKEIRSDNVYLLPSNSVKLVKGTNNTLTAPDIEGYKFSSWQVEGAYPKKDTMIKTVCKTKTFEFDQSYMSDLKYGYKHFYLYAIYNKDSCIAEGSLITLASGVQVPVEELTGTESLLVWNMKTGTFDSAPILFIDHDEAQLYKVIKLDFSGGTQIEVIYEHAFWDFNLNEYVFIRSDAEKYIGHWFNKQTIDEQGKMSWEKVQLINVNIEEKYTSAWSPVTYEHLCYYVNGMLSMPGATEGLINIFEVNAETLKYDETKMLVDIETFGLFTYEEFCESLPVSETIFEAFGGKYLKIAIGKGLIDFNTLGNLVSRYAEFFE